MGKRKSKIDELSDLMLDVAYPTLFEIMDDLGLQEVIISLNGFYPTHITAQRSMTFLNNGVATTIVANVFEKQTDQRALSLLKTTASDYKAFPPEAYYKWCELVMAKIEELKLRLPRIHSIIDRLNKIPMTYTREVLTEKNEQI